MSGYRGSIDPTAEARIRLRSLREGDRVEVQGQGTGTVGYIRYYGGQIDAIHVKLDSQANKGIHGTPCFIESVFPI